MTVRSVPLLPAKWGEGARRADEGRGGTRALIALLLLVASSAFADESTVNTTPKLAENVSIAQKLNSQIPLDLMFRDEQGKVVRLRQFFGQGRPVLLNFVYYKCPMLCPMVLEGTTTSLTELKYDIGKEFDVITVSIDPRDKPATAAAAKDKFVKHYGRLNAANGWHFLTGHDTAIHQLADSVGFRYAYDGVRDQFAHNAALLILTPDGHVSRYFYGFEYKPRDLRLAIAEASNGKIGGIAEQLLLLCYHYDPATGRYSRSAMNFVRAGGIATVAVLASFIFVMVRRERS